MRELFCKQVFSLDLSKLFLYPSFRRKKQNKTKQTPSSVSLTKEEEEEEEEEEEKRKSTIIYLNCEIIMMVTMVNQVDDNSNTNETKKK